MRSIFGGIGLTILLSLGTAGAVAAAPPSPVSDSFAITNVQVFDGSQVSPAATVVVVNGRINAVGANVAPPAGVPVIDGTGQTLLPGFIDSHAHARTRHELERAIQFGVTTEMDMWTLPQFAASMRREQERTGAPYRADFYSAINPATLPEGYPYNFTPDVTERPTLTGPEQADKFARKLLQDGADYMKIMVEDGSLVFLDLPVLSRETVRALTRAMHRRGKLAVAHVIEMDRAFDLLHDGIDGLVHMPVDQVAPLNFIRLAVMKGIFVVPTLAVEESFITTEGGAEILADPDLAPYLTAEEKAWLLAPFPPSLITQENLEYARESVRLLQEAGVPILAGTDMPTHGVSLHRDLELMVRAGLEPAEALAAATSNPAAAWGLTDRGRIAPGLRADLLLVDGDPAADIKATRKLRRIWKAGVEVDRQIPAVHPAH